MKCADKGRLWSWLESGLPSTHGLAKMEMSRSGLVSRRIISHRRSTERVTLATLKWGQIDME